MRSVLRSTSRVLIYRVPGERDTCPACESARLYELDLLSLRRPGGGRLAGYHASLNGRAVWERLRFYRLAARRAEARRRRDMLPRKSSKAATAASV
jgi:hypothetical protein